MLLCRPVKLGAARQVLLDRLSAACPEMTILAERGRAVAGLLALVGGNARELTGWITRTRAAGLP
ncbi:hypothetical protein [Streptomyces sp. NPDC087300]|uniref:hypothetical protein n=1 Tax=Streptomyces sp. NPDC087300 TaxID=3365780 RepID=UPI0038173241